MDYTIELFTGKGKHKFYWRIKARNGNILATSEGYARKCDRTRVANRLAKALRVTVKCDILLTADGKLTIS